MLMENSTMRTIWIIKGGTNGMHYDVPTPEGTVEWQFSDGPAGGRGSSADYLDLREGLEDHRGCQFNIAKADFTPEERAVYNQFIGESQNIEMLMEAAACMWEHALDLINKDPAWTEYQEGWGYASARMETIQHAPLLEADYQTVKDTYNMPFDWEFVPEWMVNNLYFDESSIKVRADRIIPTRS